MRPEDILALAARVATGDFSNEEYEGFKRCAWLCDYSEDMDNVIDLATEKVVARDWIEFAGKVVNGDISLDKNAPKVAMQSKPQIEEVPRITYLYETRTPTIPLTVETQVTAIFTTEITGYEPAPCQSQASLACDPKEPNLGFARILPESMLPGSTPEKMVQCLECYEASAEAYVRKLHNA